jgi:hypothetical protein
MTRNVLVGVAVLTVSLLAIGMRAKQSAQQDVACSLNQKGEFSPGWMESNQAAHYRCMPTFDAALKPSGAAWVKVEADGSIGRQLPK